ncbi:hypothetical protein LR013_04360 [candidate division NPL-UPA2 bacterium]|nr:hypothetical protein [candidate division NPL-UPA2 bacterium]
MLWYNNSMDKRAFKITCIYDDDDHDFRKKKTYLERIEALGKLRKTIFGYEPSTSRL